MEIMVRGGAQPIDSVAEIDARQIAGKDLLLGQPRLEPEGDDDLLRLALDCAIAGQEARLRQLLGDGATALPNAAAAHVGDEGPSHPARVDPPVSVKTTVLDRDEGRR